MRLMKCGKILWLSQIETSNSCLTMFKALLLQHFILNYIRFIIMIMITNSRDVQVFNHMILIICYQSQICSLLTNQHHH